MEQPIVRVADLPPEFQSPPVNATTGLPSYCYIVSLTERSGFITFPDDPRNKHARFKKTTVENVLYSRSNANGFVRGFFSHQLQVYPDSNNPPACVANWGPVWVPAGTTSCNISKEDGLCKIIAKVGKGDDGTMYTVEIAKEEINDADVPFEGEA